MASYERTGKWNILWESPSIKWTIQILMNAFPRTALIDDANQNKQKWQQK